ncbi:MAG: RIP metalloprotease RseP [Candidatus Pacebacteria bacterium]|nr:RIP metalloprotease RseP [Candidatus Paceibacterota bacterium]NUQ57631.1 RIP metalloprotease RseP [Candidatus Paceibacter sp.]
MSIVLFFIVLAVLILSHEFGHFLAAKRSGVKVEEFGFGFPPKIFKFKRGETVYSLNAIPFGGFVKITGEEGENKNDPRSFSFKPIWVRTMIIAAGVVFNVILAWFLLAVGFMAGMPSSVQSAPSGAEIKDRRVIILQVAEDSPAKIAGLKPGDEIAGFPGVEEFKSFIAASLGKEIEIKYRRDGKDNSARVVPRENPPAGEGAIGISMDEIGTVKLPVLRSFLEGAKTTYNVLIGTALSFYNFVAAAIKGEAGLGAITGPIGIAGFVGSAAKFGFGYFVSFVAFLSVNLAIINILPFPALDGGRILFLAIEKIKGSPVSPRISAAIHGAGMALLLALMLLVTFKDILKLVS